jgi:hypothetical protein
MVAGVGTSMILVDGLDIHAIPPQQKDVVGPARRRFCDWRAASGAGGKQTIQSPRSAATESLYTPSVSNTRPKVGHCVRVHQRPPRRAREATVAAREGENPVLPTT